MSPSLAPTSAATFSRRPLRLGPDVAQPARVSRRLTSDGRSFGR
jgi:hypothetical protein